MRTLSFDHGVGETLPPGGITSPTCSSRVENGQEDCPLTAVQGPCHASRRRTHTAGMTILHRLTAFICLKPRALQELSNRQQTMHGLLITGSVVLPNIRQDQTHQNHLAEVVSGWTNVRRRHAGFPISSGLTPSSIPPLDEGQINHRDTDKDEENSRCDLQSLVERERCRTVQGLRSSEFRRRCDPTPPWRWRS